MGNRGVADFERIAAPDSDEDNRVGADTAVNDRAGAGLNSIVAIAANDRIDVSASAIEDSSQEHHRRFEWHPARAMERDRPLWIHLGRAYQNAIVGDLVVLAPAVDAVGAGAADE